MEKSTVLDYERSNKSIDVTMIACFLCMSITTF